VLIARLASFLGVLALMPMCLVLSCRHTGDALRIELIG
jgi:hypothetical protein